MYGLKFGGGDVLCCELWVALSDICCRDHRNGTFTISFPAAKGSFTLTLSALGITLPVLHFTVRSSCDMRMVRTLNDNDDQIGLTSLSVRHRNPDVFRGACGFALHEPSGFVYVAFTDLHCIKKLYLNDGVCAQVFGSPDAIAGSALGQFCQPRGLCMANESTLIVADTGNARIVVIDVTNETIIDYFPRPDRDAIRLDRPYGVAHLNDMVLVSDTYQHRVLALSWSQRWQLLYQIGETGTYGATPRQLSYPFGVSADRDADEVYVCDQHNNRVQVFCLTDGSFKRTLGGEKGSGPGQLLLPSAAVADSRRGCVYVCDRENSRVQIFRSLDGACLGAFQSLSHPMAIAMDTQTTHVWVSDTAHVLSCWEAFR